MDDFETDRRRALAQLAQEIADVQLLMANLQRITGICESPPSHHEDRYAPDKWQRLIRERSYTQANAFVHAHGRSD